MDSNSLYKSLSNKAVQLLAQRNHSSAELKQKLSFFYLKNFANGEDHDALDLASSQIDSVIQYCLSHHWLNDEDYIKQYIDMRTRKGYGQNRIIMELKQRGLNNSLILDVINQKDINWHTLAITQVKKKFPSINKSDIQQKAKIFKFLFYRGFLQDEVNHIYSLL